eukprot:13091622-Alexandrium_andersonii.AAC.1
MSSGPKIQPGGDAVLARRTGQPALSAAPNQRKSETPCRTAKRKRRRAKGSASCAWTCGTEVSDFRRLGAAERA